MRLIGINKSVTTTAHETLLVSSSRLPRRAWEPVNLLSSFPRSARECNGTSKGYHAERGSQMKALLVPPLRVGMQRYQQGLPRRAWEPDVYSLLCITIYSLLCITVYSVLRGIPHPCPSPCQS